jgi:2-oxoglutarate/2-oxoacid ferredoxin oxidoreductase subunit alpha
MPTVIDKDSITIRFAGDSGDGMQLTGTQFTTSSALFGNDVSTFPDYPAEIRAPAGTVAGVSGFQIQFANRDIYTPGDSADCLVAMNPAALKSSLVEVDINAMIVVNADAFNQQNIDKAGYKTNPLEDGSLSSYQVCQVPITTLTLKSLEGLDIPRKQGERCKNFFALGLAFWIFDRPTDTTISWIESKFSKTPAVMEANKRALMAGFSYGDTTEIFRSRYRINKAPVAPGLYRQISGNEATALGLTHAAITAGRPLYYGSYPITPASDILHELSKLTGFGVYTFQAEDEIAAMCATIGAAFAGAISITGTSGPGLCLKSEAINLAIVTELPMVIVNVQRGGPSTGLPTKTEQADLLQAYFGRNGESPIIILAPQSPSDCFFMAHEAVRLSLRAMAPVILLSDGYIGNGAEPLLIPEEDAMPKVEARYHTDAATFQPYNRDPETLARPWAIPGTPGLEHRIGGLEKQDITGNVSYDSDNHQHMILRRAEKVRLLENAIPDLEVFGKQDGELLILGWGGTYGSLRGAAERLVEEGYSVGHAQLRYLNPFPKNLGDVLGRFKTVLIPEINMGQLALLLRARYLRNFEQLNMTRGVPIKIREVYEKALQILGGKR